MPKSIIIEPERVFASQISFTSADIPVNAYRKTIRRGAARTTRAQDFLNIWQDMCAIREFETILNEIKTKGAYKGVTYNHAGPAHLSIGQEAAAVGMAFALGPGRPHLRLAPQSRRNSGEGILRHPQARATTQLLDDHASPTATARCCGRWRRAISGNVKGLALRFFVYGAYSEIFARETGFNRGLGGSMHAFFAPFGIYPNNAIVGGSGSIAPGAALFKRVNRKPGIVVANIGDASFGCGPVWEGITLLGDGPVPQAVGRVAGRRPADHVQLHEQFLRHGRPAARRDDGRASASRASAPASIPSRCTPSASTATIRCR